MHRATSGLQTSAWVTFATLTLLAVQPQSSCPLQGEGAFAGHCDSCKSLAQHPTQHMDKSQHLFTTCIKKNSLLAMRYRVASCGHLSPSSCF